MSFIRVAKKVALRKAAIVVGPMLTNRYFSKYREHTPSWGEERAIISLTFDCDLGDDIKALPKLFEMLNTHDIRASFGCIGKWIEKESRLHIRMLELGHEIINHTYSHPDSIWNKNLFDKLITQEQETEILKCNETLKKILDYEPTGFRTPHFGRLHGEAVYDILEKEGFLYSSSTNMARVKSFGFPYYPKRGNVKNSGHATNSYKIIELPVMMCPKHFFPLLDTVHCIRAPHPAHSERGAFFEIFKNAISIGLRYKTMLNFDWGPADVIKSKDFLEILEIISKYKKSIAVMKLEDVARLWKKHVGGYDAW